MAWDLNASFVVRAGHALSTPARGLCTLNSEVVHVFERGAHGLHLPVRMGTIAGRAAAPTTAAAAAVVLIAGCGGSQPETTSDIANQLVGEFGTAQHLTPGHDGTRTTVTCGYHPNPYGYDYKTTYTESMKPLLHDVAAANPGKKTIDASDIEQFIDTNYHASKGVLDASELKAFTAKYGDQGDGGYTATNVTDEAEQAIQGCPPGTQVP